MRKKTNKRTPKHNKLIIFLNLRNLDQNSLPRDYSLLKFEFDAFSSPKGTNSVNLCDPPVKPKTDQ